MALGAGAMLWDLCHLADPPTDGHGSWQASLGEKSIADILPSPEECSKETHLNRSPRHSPRLLSIRSAFSQTEIGV